MTAVTATGIRSTTIRPVVAIGSRETVLSATASRSVASSIAQSSATFVPAGTDRGATIASPRTKLRITNRGRAVLSALIALPVAAVLGMGLLMGGAGAVATSTQSVNDFDYVTVQAGETLWGIAEEVAPESDPRDVIARIVSLNQLQTQAVQPGQELAIPGEYAAQ